MELAIIARAQEKEQKCEYVEEWIEERCWSKFMDLKKKILQ